MATTSAPSTTEVRHQPRIRWPHPDAATLGLVALWLVGVVVALLVPALFVSPGARTAPAGDVWLAFGSTVVGSAMMLTASFLLWRRHNDAGAMVLGGVPAVACVAGGIILAASKITGM